MNLLIDDVKEGGWADIIARNGRAGKLITVREIRIGILGTFQ